VSEPRNRRRGRGIDAIFDSTDIELEPKTEPQNPQDLTEERSPRQQEERALRRGPGRPRLEPPPARELVQRGFYLEVSQDRMIDEIKVGLKGRGFNPDRSAIIRAAVEYFHELDRFNQEERVRRSK
jgi:hypothetical protein